MSTTSDLAVAASYGLSRGSLLFKIRTNNAIQRGVSLQWLSAFPAEAEFCFPPLTFLQPTGRTQDVRVGQRRFHIVEVEPHLP